MLFSLLTLRSIRPSLEGHKKLFKSEDFVNS